MKLNLLSFGTVYLDILCPHFPLPQQLKPFQELEIIGSTYAFGLGGSALNFAKVASELGISISFIGKCGEDRIGQLLEEEVKKASLKAHFIKSADVQTNISFNMTSEDGRLLMFVLGNANTSLKTIDVLEKMRDIEQPIDALYLGGVAKLLNKISYEKVIQEARKKNFTIIIDHGRLTQVFFGNEKSKLQEIILASDIYLPSKEEFLSLWGYTSIDEGIFDYRKKNPQGLIVVKDGINGSKSFYENSVVSQEIFPVDIHSLAGAGDAFNAGFIFHYFNNKDLKKALIFASATAAMKIAGMSTLSEKGIYEFIQNKE